MKEWIGIFNSLLGSVTGLLALISVIITLKEKRRELEAKEKGTKKRRVGRRR
ncbi:hypothetical protein D3C71_1758810 [compost metagenome]